METTNTWSEGVMQYFALVQVMTYVWVIIGLPSIITKNPLLSEVRRGLQTIMMIYSLALIAMVVLKVHVWSAFVSAIMVLWFCKKVIDAPKSGYR